MPQFVLSVYMRIPTELGVVKNGQCGIKLTLKNFTKNYRPDMKKVMAGQLMLLGHFWFMYVCKNIFQQRCRGGK